jgi:membrane-associated protein
MFGLTLPELIRALGYAGVFGMVFAESGLFVGFFLPGDSLLFTAGLVASQGFLNLPALIIVCLLGAILGDSFGYTFGRKVGKSLFSKPQSKLFNPEYLHKARRFYDQHGTKTIVLARFVPFVRTFAPILAGVGGMKYSLFLTYNIIGATLWTITLPLVGYFLGSAIPNIDHYILPIIILIILLSLVPPMLEYWRGKRK